MRRNEPITNNRKYFTRDDQKLVSTTDKKGVITEANDAFIDISGYAEEELIGQAHNLVRHPFMPQWRLRSCGSGAITAKHGWEW